ncbi:MAG: hypothetical protein WCG27_00335 [Pseudomonadota bacterium]
MRTLFLTLFFISLVTFNSAFAGIRVNISVIQKKGMDKGLVLINEFHTVEEIDDRQGLTLDLKNGMKIKLTYQFMQDQKDYGPSNIIKIQGQVWEGPQKLLFSFQDDPMIIHLGESKTFTHVDKDSGQQIELIIRPDIL